MFSALLSYPTSEMRAALDEMAGLIERSPLIAPAERPVLLALIASLGEGDLLDAEERYCELFDRGRALSLHLFEHLHGESRDRGTAMVELKQLYRAAGFDLVGNELPDYLPVVLEYLSCRELPEARDMLVEVPRTDGVEQPVLVPGNPIKLSDMAEGPEARVPWLGEHTDAVLAAELGLDDAAIAALRESGAIA